MPTRNVVLTDHNEQVIAALVASGQYQNASEVLRDGLRMVESRMEADAAHLAWLRAEVQVGIDDIERGNSTRFHDRASLRAHLKHLADTAISSSTAQA